MTLPKILLAAGLAAHAVPAVASADSIVYIDQRNVWSATPDGSRKVQLNHGRRLALAHAGRRRHARRRPGHRSDRRDGARRPAAAHDHDAAGEIGRRRVLRPESGPAFLLARRHEFACSTTGGDERYGDPSWSPDGAGLAYESSKGIETTRFTQFGAGTCITAEDRILSATGSEPDWGPADPPAAASTPPAPAPATAKQAGPVTVKLSKVKKSLTARSSPSS
jgi:hypothetical protein